MSCEKASTGFIPWEKEEGVYILTKWNHFLMKLGLRYRTDFVTRETLQEMTELSDEEFKEMWSQLQDKGAVKKVLVKHNDKGHIIDLFDAEERLLGE